MGKNDTACNIVLRELRAVGDWVPLEVLRSVGGGAHADRRVRELRARGHTIENRQGHGGPEFRLTREGKPRCPECSQDIGQVHGFSCRMRGLEVKPGHTKG